MMHFVCVSAWSVITPSNFYTAPNTERTVLAEKRVGVALRHFLVLFLECVCLPELNISFSLLSREERYECVCVCEKILIDVCLCRRYALGSRLLNRKTLQMVCAVCVCTYCASVHLSVRAVLDSRRHLSPRAHFLPPKKENGIIDSHHRKLGNRCT